MELKNLSEIIIAIQKNIVLLPHFQREYVWNKTQQKNLILSVLTNLPSSSSLLLRKQNTDKFKCIRIGMRSEVIGNAVNAYHTDLNQYNTQFSYHYIDTSWSTVDLRQENDIKELFKIRYNSIKQSITTTIDSSLFSD